MPHGGGIALQCPTVGAWHFNAPRWGHGTSVPHGGGMAPQGSSPRKRCGHCIPPPHKHLAQSVERPPTTPRGLKGRAVVWREVRPDRRAATCKFERSPSPHLMPASSGTLVQAKRWHVAGDEALMSEREARITVTGLYNQADVLCIKTCSCLHAVVRRYKQMLVRCRGWTPDVQKGGTHHTGTAKQPTRCAEHKTLLCLHTAVCRYKLNVATLPGMNL